MGIFDQIANKYDSEKQLALASVINQEVQAKLGDISAKKILDYGCGTGLIGLPLAEKAKSVLLLDPSEAMIAITKQKIQAMKLTNAVAQVGTTETVTISQEKVDIILMSLVMLHVPETKKLLTALYDGLKLGGRLLIVDFDKNEAIQDERVHNGFVHAELLELVESIGFKENTIETFYRGEKLFMNQDAALFIFEGWKK